MGLSPSVPSALPDPSPTDNAAAVSLAVSAVADLSVTKTASATEVGVNQLVSYTITVLTGGPSAALDVSVFEDIPAGGTVQSAAPGQGSFDASTSIWSVGTVLPGRPQVLTVVVSYTGVGDTVNVVSVAVEGVTGVATADAEVAVQPTTPGSPDDPGSPPPNPPAAGADGEMAYTGFPVGDLVRWALVLLVLGVAFVGFGRRRRGGSESD